jgi:hypothetical protein
LALTTITGVLKGDKLLKTSHQTFEFVLQRDNKRSAEDWGLPLVARQGRSPSAGLVSLDQREAQRLLLFGSDFSGVGVAAGKGPQRCVVEDGKAAHFVLQLRPVKRGSKCPFVSSCWVSPELRCSVIVPVDVTPHRFVLIRSGMRIPSASVYQPPRATDA